MPGSGSHRQTPPIMFAANLENTVVWPNDVYRYTPQNNTIIIGRQVIEIYITNNKKTNNLTRRKRRAGLFVNNWFFQPW